MKKLISVILSLVLIMSLFATTYAFSTVAVKGISLDSKSITLGQGKTYSLKVSFTPANTSQKLLSYTTSNKNVATIDNTGKIKGIKEGTATITVTSASNKKIKAVCTVTVGYDGSLPLVAKKETLTFATHSGVSPTYMPASNDLPVWKEYEKLTNVHINFQVIPYANYGDVITARMAANQDLPDIIDLTKVTTPITKLMDDGVLIDQTKLLEKYGYYSKKFFSDPANTFWKYIMNTPDGRFAGFSDVVATHTLATGYMMNTAWLKKLKLPEPTTTAQLYNTLKMFKTKDPNGNGKADEVPLSTDDFSLDYIANSFGLEIQGMDGYSVDSKGKAWSDWTSPKYKQYLTYVNQLYKEGLLDNGFLKADNNTMLQYATNNQVGLLIWWQTWAYIFSNANKTLQAKPGDPVYYPTAPVKGPSGDQYTLHRIIKGDDTMGITKSCKDPVTAFKWIDFLFNSPQSTDIMNWGVEGITYKNVNGQKEKIIQKDKDGKDVDWGTSLYNIGGGQPPRAHQQSVEAWKLYTPQWEFDASDAVQKYYKAPTLLPIAWTTEEGDKLSSINADLTTYIKEMRQKFITGTEPLSNFDKYVATVKSMGGDDVLALYQQKADRMASWMGKK